MLEEKREKAVKAASGDGPASKKPKVTATKKAEILPPVRIAFYPSNYGTFSK